MSNQKKLKFIRLWRNKQGRVIGFCIGSIGFRLYLVQGPLMDSSSPSVNIDGTPMCGSSDARGHPFGISR